MKQFKISIKGVNELRKSEEMKKILKEYADTRTPKGCESFVRVHKKRAVAYIHPITQRAYKDNLKNNTLVKAIKQ